MQKSMERYLLILLPYILDPKPTFFGKKSDVKVGGSAYGRGKIFFCLGALNNMNRRCSKTSLLTKQYSFTVNMYICAIEI